MSDSVASFFGRALRRRSFFRVAGATAATSMLVLAGCGSDDTGDPNPTVEPVGTLSFGSGDTGILNYAYLLEQLEAAFYQKVVEAFPSDFTAEDKAAFVDLRDHEVIHREFMKFALGESAYDTNKLPLVFNFTSLTLTTRAGVYAAAQTLEDVGVAAYNGAAKLLTDVTYLQLFSKISSVEARHAAFVREQVQPGSFAGADVVPISGDTAGLDVAKTPAEVAKLIAPFVTVMINTDSLPTT
ncbi:hypothetical protein GCM10027346_13760 [Hymenobacter seoulensis]